MAASPGHSVINSMRRIVQALRHSSRRSEAELGVSSAQLFVLQKLAATPQAISMSDLAALTLTHISSVSVVVSRLVESGLVLKQSSVQDGRRTEVLLSEKGRNFLQNQPRTAQEDLIAAVERLPDGERKILAALLEKLIDDAGFSGTESPMFFEDAVRNHDAREGSFHVAKKDH